MAGINKLIEGGTSEIVVKKSRFLGVTFPIETPEEAADHIAAIRKKYYDARHNCYAYRLTGAEKFSDDGEPSQTAGKPMLDVLTGAGLTGALVVVTRYFGGTLLGTGGLVRAYTEAAQAAVKASRIMEIRPRRHVECRIAYSDLGRVQYIFREAGLEPATDYQEEIVLSAEVPEELCERLREDIINATAARGQVTLGDVYLG
ncbi:MAG: YigZ family protein [Eubacterium sp.]|nr:YigZ family protein [Eubacterium sp.]